jgi:hypothetical protein
MPLTPPICLQAFFNPGGSSGNDYTTTMSITPQPYMANGVTNAEYNGTNVAVGMYASSNFNGQMFRIKSISSQTSGSVTAVLEDIGGLNKTIDRSGGIAGGGPISGVGYIFEVNSEGLPILTAINNAPTITFPDSILGRFIYDKQPVIAPSTLTETYSVAVGQGGSTIATSADGIAWASRTSGLTTAGRGISWNGSTWVAIGEGNSSIVTSSDGINWTDRASSPFITVNDVQFNGSYWLAGGTTSSGGIIARSNDGLTWVPVAACPFTVSCNALAWGGSLWVAGGDGSDGIGGRTTLATSSDGITWTPQLSTLPVCYTVAWNGSTWVAGGGNGVGTRVVVSSNATLWTSVPTSGLLICYTVAWNGSYWLAGGSRATTSAISLSVNGGNWTVVTHPSTITTCYSLRWDGSTWMAGGNSSRLMTSANGTSWVAGGTSDLTTCRVVEWNGASWLIGGDGGTRMSRSINNGSSWTSISTHPFQTTINVIRVSGTTLIAGGTGDVTNPAIATSFNDTSSWIFKQIFSTSGRAIASNGTIWVAGGQGRNTIATSPDGITWTGRTSPFTTRVNDVAWNGFIWVAGGQGTTTIATSSDGIAWTARTAPFNTACHSVAWNGLYWVAGGETGNTIATSSDGITWTNRTSPFSTACYAVAWNGTIWVAGGQGGSTLATSADGITWTARTSPFSTACYAVIWNGYNWVAGGQGGSTLATSADGITWTARTSPFSTSVNHISTRRTLPFIPSQFPGNAQQLSLAHVGTASGPSIYQNSSPNTGFYFPSANTVAISTSGTERMTFSATGPIGIGTTNPRCNLQIIDTITAGSTAGFPNSSTLLSVLDTIPYNTAGSVLAEIGGHNRDLGNHGTIYKYQLGLSNTTTQNGGNFVINAVPTASNGYNVDGTTVNRLTIVGANGNVGIGTPNPRCKFQVVDSYSTPIGPTDTTPSASTHLSVLDNVTQNSSNEAVLMEIGAQNRSVGSASANVIYKYQAGFQNTNDTRGGNFVINAIPSSNPYTSDGTALNRFNITTLGNVGIGGLPGPSGPQGRLHVFGTSNDNAGHGMLCIENGQIFGYGIPGVGTSATFKSQWAGDGLQAPAIMGKIDVIKEDGANVGDSYMAFSTRYTVDRNTGGVGVLNERMRINALGNVGIGATGPQAKLDVNGGIQLFGLEANNLARPAIATGPTVPAYEFRAKTVNGDDGFVRLRAGGTTNSGSASYMDICGFSSITDMNRSILLGTSGTERMRIDSNGNVGIGRNVPSQRLDVAGRIRGIGNIVNTTTYSEYVNSWTVMAGSSGWVILTLTFRPVQTSGNVKLVINASVELAFDSGTGDDNLQWEMRVGGTPYSTYRINYSGNTVAGRGLGANNFGAGTAVVTVSPNVDTAIGLITIRGGDDALYARNAYLVIHELSNAT